MRKAKFDSTRYLRCFLGAILLALVIRPGYAAADTGPWSKPVNLSGNVGAWFPSIAADDAGNVAVVWAQPAPVRSSADLASAADRAVTTDGTGVNWLRDVVTAALYYTHWNGQSWSKPNDIGLATNGIALRSSITADALGQLHLVRLGMGQPTPDALTNLGLWYTNSSAGTAGAVAAWSAPWRVSRYSQGYFSDIVVDRRGVIHVIWTESTNDSWGIYYSHSADRGRTWSRPVALDGNDSVWWYRAHITVDAQDRLHVVWEIVDSRLGADVASFGTTHAAYYALSTDGGQTWAKRRFPPEPSSDVPYEAADRGPQQPTVGVDGKGTILFIFRDPVTNQVVYSRSVNGSVWSEPVPIDGIEEGVDRPYDVYNTATDSAGHVHLVLVGYPSGSTKMSLLHVEWDGKRWGKPSAIVSSPPYPEYPRITIGQGNHLNVVWFDGNRATTERSPEAVWYSTAVTSAPPIERASSTTPQLPSMPSHAVAVSTNSQQNSSALPVNLPSDDSTRLLGRDLDTPIERSAFQERSSYPLVVAMSAILPLLLIIVVVKLRMFRISEIRLWRQR